MRIAELFKKQSRKHKTVGRFAPAVGYVPGMSMESSLEEQFIALQEEVNRLEGEEDFLRKMYSRHVQMMNHERPSVLSPFENENYRLPLQKAVEIPQVKKNPLFGGDNTRRVRYKTEHKIMKVSVLGPGEIIGLEDSLYHNGGRLTTVTCKSKRGVVLAISVEELLKRLPREEMRRNIFQFAEMRLRFMEQRICAFIALS